MTKRILNGEMAPQIRAVKDPTQITLLGQGRGLFAQISDFKGLNLGVNGKAFGDSGNYEVSAELKEAVLRVADKFIEVARQQHARGNEVDFYDLAHDHNPDDNHGDLNRERLASGLIMLAVANADPNGKQVNSTKTIMYEMGIPIFDKAQIGLIDKVEAANFRKEAVTPAPAAQSPSVSNGRPKPLGPPPVLSPLP